MDRRSLGAPLPAHGRRHRLARAPPIAAGVRTPGRLKRVLAGLALVVAAAVAGVVVYVELRPAHPRTPAAPPTTTRQQQPPSAGTAPLLVGVDDDTLKWISDPLTAVERAQRLGAAAVRIWVPWNGGALPNAARREELARAAQAARHTAVVLAVYGFAANTPLDDATQARFCGYARAALALVPNARAVVVWNEANSAKYWSGSASDYERLLARCYDELHAERPRITVLDSTASAHAPAAFLRSLGDAYRASGRTTPIVDAFGHNPYPRTSDEQPWTAHAAGFLGEGDYPRLAATLEQAFSGTGQRSLGVWYLEDGYQTAVPSPLARDYSGHENAITITADEQAARLADALRLAACQPTVHAFFNFEVVDETQLGGWQSGLLWGDTLPKPAATAFAETARALRAGHDDCSALGTEAAAAGA